MPIFSKGDDVKITLPLNSAEWHGHETETLWASPLSKYQYQIQNVPFFAKGVSRFDVVNAIAGVDGLVFKSVAKGSGHSTVRLVSEASPDSMAFLAKAVSELQSAGCALEKGSVSDVTVYAVDVPPNVDFDQIVASLEKWSTSGYCDWEMGNDEHPES